MTQMRGEPRVVNIRKAVIADKEAITKLEKLSLVEPDKAPAADQQWLLSAATVEVATIVLIAEAEGTPVGYISGVVVNEGTCIRGYICDSYVDEKYKRLRAAVHIMDEMILKMRELGARVFFTNYVKKNLALLKLTEQPGFVKLNTQEFYNLVKSDSRGEA